MFTLPNKATHTRALHSILGLQTNECIKHNLPHKQTRSPLKPLLNSFIVCFDTHQKPLDHQFRWKSKTDKKQHDKNACHCGFPIFNEKTLQCKNYFTSLQKYVTFYPCRTWHFLLRPSICMDYLILRNPKTMQKKAHAYMYESNQHACMVLISLEMGFIFVSWFDHEIRWSAKARVTSTA